MMKQQIKMELLKQVDEMTEERIAEEFPINTDNEELFEKAYQNYLKQSQNLELPSLQVHHNRKQLYRNISFAACLFLTMGLTLGVWKKQQKLESRPMQETPTGFYTEISTEQQTEIQQLEQTSTSKNQQTESPQLQETPPHTETKTETVTLPVIQTDTIQIPQSEIVSNTESDSTAPPISENTESIITDITEFPEVIIEINETPIPEETALPADTESVTRSTAVTTVMTETIQTSISPATVIETTIDTIFETESLLPVEEAEIPTEEILPDKKFFVIKNNGEYTYVLFSAPADVLFPNPEQPDKNPPQFILELDGFLMQEVNGKEERNRYFKIIEEKNQKKRQLEQIPYGDFVISFLSEYNSIQNINIKEKIGYLITMTDEGMKKIGISERKAILIWDDNTGISMIQSFEENPEILIYIAEHISNK